MIVFIIVILAIIIGLLITNIRIVPQANAFVIERLGAYKETWQVGLHVKIPLIDIIAKKVSLKETVIDFPPQPVITKDNVTMKIDTVIYYQITDPMLYTYGVANPLAAIENLTATTLRNIIGELELDESLTSREIINSKIRIVLDEATDPWGIKINRVEVKNIMPPQDIQEAMEKQMRAEREKREAILRAEGEQKSAILIADGQKQSQILAAEAEKQATILAAEAARESAIKRAEGEAEAIRKVQEAQADAIKMINAANPSDQVITLRSLDAFQKAADGQATKLIIPSDIQGVAGLAGALKEIVTEK
ncbi:MAG: SPFH domain-containing protein [Anaerovoracaceae bacterium]|jgi:regulator of protease activity HflC (stomatin/prohibitin superfamily)